MSPYSPLSHLIAFGLLGWLYVMFNRVTPAAEPRGARISVLGVLLAWLLASSLISYRGYYLALNEDYLLLTIATAMPFFLLGALALVSKSVRRLLRLFIDRIPLESLTLVHVLRIAAIGTIYKWQIGALPAHFIIPVGIPDFLMGLTAFPMCRRVARSRATDDTLLLIWNIIGAGVYVLAPFLIQISQPGPLHFISGSIRTDEVFSFPMSIVPTLIAPLLLGLHFVAILRITRSRHLGVV